MPQNFICLTFILHNKINTVYEKVYVIFNIY